MRRIRGLDLMGAQILDLEEISGDDWRGVDHERNGGICRYTWQMAITRIADLIGALYVLEINEPMNRVNIDRAGNIWLGADYLAPHQYLVRLIPKSAP